MFDILKNKSLHIGVGAFLTLITLTIMFVIPKNYGIDMTGGSQIEYSYDSNIDIDQISQTLGEVKDIFNTNNNNAINGLGVYKVSGENKIVLEVGFNDIKDEIKEEKLKSESLKLFSQTLLEIDNSFVMSKYTSIGKSFGDYIKKTAILTLAIALIGIVAYVAWAFYGIAAGIPAMSFGVIVLFTQFLDVMVASSLYVFVGKYFSQFQVDTFFITALLTILGYSINNTIVVFDRVRENLKKYIKEKDLREIINLSIHETARRSIYTTLTVLFVMGTIFFFGPLALQGFMLVMIFGVTFGVYSSLFIAGSLLFFLNENRKIEIIEKRVISDDEKIVV